MHIKSLHLKNFRNYADEQVVFSSATNIIYGNNAQGKTNLLEAIYMFSSGKSHRTKNDSDLIMFGEEFARTEMEFADKNRLIHMRMNILGAKKKNFLINDVPVVKLSTLMDYLNTVMFTPEDLGLIKGMPSLRRRFLDFAISQMYPNYLGSLISYNKSLIQKNALLKQLKAAGKTKDDSLSAWNIQLSGLCMELMKYRIRFITEFGKWAGEINNQISKEKLSIHYAPSINCDIIEEVSAEYICSRLEYVSDKEIFAGAAQLGIHRDDLIIRINDTDARVYASQGQQRTAVLSMKIAQTEYINSVRGEYPVLLLDDIMSELDKTRREFLAEKIKDKQVIITCTDADAAYGIKPEKLLFIKSGKITDGG